MPQEADGAMLIYLLWIAYIYACVWSRSNQYPSQPRDVSKETVDARPARDSQRLDPAFAALPSASHRTGVDGNTPTIADVLSDIERRDSSFQITAFLEGASAAYEAITIAFANGDRATLRQLVSKDVYEAFIADIVERERRNERSEATFVRIALPEIVDARICDHEAEISVRFRSELFNVARGPAGAVVRGNPTRAMTAADTWTFVKEIPSSEPTWRMVASSPA